MLSAKLKAAAGNSADATLYVNDVFSTWLYTGTGATQTITNGIDLAGKGGLVWVKTRSAGSLSHSLNDTARGVGYSLSTNNTTAQSLFYNDELTAFNSTGFTLGADVNQGIMNLNASTYASWTFRKAAKFFDVVTYTGTGSARTIAHSLGVAPGMIIVKRTDTTGNWQVYHRSLTSAAYSMQLNLTAAQASAPTVWNSTAPTSSVFSVGTDATVNASGGTYVAYLYAHDTSSTGIIQCGSVATDASGNWSANLGWEPQYILWRNPNGVANWEIADTMRGASLSDTMRLFPNLSNAEASAAGAYVYPTATGFVGVNGPGPANGTIIYMAIRMPNKPPTTGTQVYNSVAYTGNGTAGRTVTSNFVVDLAIGMQRTPANGSDRFFVNRLVGATKGLVSWDTFAEATDANSLTSFALMTGVTVGSDTADRGFNGSGRSLNPYFFKRAPGFFDVVCYTGNGVAGSTQAHNLTVVPELMIVKCRSNASSSWRVLYQPTGIVGQLESTVALVTTNREFYFGDDTNYIAPTSTVFTVASNSSVNTSARTYVAYLFATLAGISKVGSYTGNGTGQAIACGFGSGGARFVLIKRTDAIGAWYTFDSARGLTSGSSPYLLLNSLAAEVTGNNGVYASPGGFTLGSTASTTTNIASATYIYLSIA
jgi:hypothetical protein